MGLLTVAATDLDAAAFVPTCGTVLETFDRFDQSGNVSWIVATEDGELFAKSAGRRSPPPGAPTPYFDHAGRIRLLRNAIEVATSCDHPALARLRNVVESADGPVLVYDRAPGKLVSANREEFSALAGDSHVSIITQLYDAHAALAAAGWVACDLYDGCLLVDVPTDRLTLIDLDAYSRGPFVNEMGRMFGSTRYMAPEEFTLGATIDERTTVFTLARLALHLGTGLSDDASLYVGGAARAEVLLQATAPNPADRVPDVASLAAAY